MRLVFYGAADRVTGSCHILECAGRRVLLDCGLIQGGREEEAANRRDFPFAAGEVDAVVLSHAHIDHSGRLPWLSRSGFDGPIYAQSATVDLCRIMLRDAGFLQEKEADTENRKRERKGLPPLAPLFTVADAEAVMGLFRPLPYEQRTEILPGIAVRFREAGHILGSAVVEVWLTEGDLTKKICFSGDLGQRSVPILRDPAVVAEADVVLLESTYGDRLHRSFEATLDELTDIFREATSGRGNILIPSFAVGRSQELLYLFAKHGPKWGLDGWQIFLDSPMAIEATEVYTRHVELYDAEAARLWRERGATALPNLSLTRTSDESRAINRIRSGAVIMAGSGMCEGGRIKHHLKNNLWRRECHVIFVGYQAKGTLGRRLVDGSRHVRLWGETIRVAASIHTVGGLSAHADQDGLAAWYGGFAHRPPVYLVHGEERPRAVLADVLAQRFDAPVITAAPGMVVDLGERAAA
ncbi:MAG: MBL fold metallo-hydrolase [Gammaproteobacteria bacterium]